MCDIKETLKKVWGKIGQKSGLTNEKRKVLSVTLRVTDNTDIENPIGIMMFL